MDAAISVSEEEFTPQGAYYAGRAAAARILNRYPLYNGKPEIIQYLNMICAALAINSPTPNWYNGYHVMILDSPELNAFSTPGGHIFISRGLIAAVSSEDMLAAVIAHELAHIQLRHCIVEFEHQQLVNDLDALAHTISREISIEEQNRLFSESVNEIVNTLFVKGYSQLQEYEADASAVEILAAAGYYPGGLVETLNILKTIQSGQGGLNSTHPSPAQRIVNVERRISLYRASDTRSFRQERFNKIMKR
jgi:predicted Zn-dependent protease